MFIAMNRFKIALGKESEFIAIWRNRETYLHEVPGFREFHLLQGPSNEDFTLFASHSTWESKEAFEAWTRSEAFRNAHASAGGSKELYLGPPQFEGFEVVL
ncbi:antibiotic biosynthesis monooxygenase [Methylocaldum sp. 14B]|jgi:heme-degrading monooxygenase HmoA|uniref:antibiotic biosynthesis monooxygenase family protein n=1 Tax=Methylocaldum sp. 14B TaxID=1912213 RepID=UPI00098B7A2D|nr:antibiotic biosynthesis monooxygenase [Methylocaldum sp. 14B]